MKRVITYGTFDLLHYGHINLLKRAREQGDYLVVALSTDEFNWNEKQKKCYFSYEQRKQLLEAVRYVDLVIPEESWEQKRTDVHEYHIDTFVMGDDWEGKFDFLKEEGVEVVYLPRTPEISTTQIKQELHKFYLEEDDLMMEGEFVTGEGKNYVITGVATIEGERYHEFEIEFELLQEPAEMTLEAIMSEEWDWYDFLC